MQTDICIFQEYYSLFRVLLPNLAEDLVQKAIDPIYFLQMPGRIRTCDSCQSELPEGFL